MSTIERLRTAVLERDPHKMVALFADDARVYSPIKFSPFTDRHTITTLFDVLLTHVFDDFRYVGELHGICEMDSSDETTAHVLPFRAAVGNRQVHGIDLVHLNDSGLIEEFTIMLRPRSALNAVLDRANAGLTAKALLAQQ